MISEEQARTSHKEKALLFGALVLAIGDIIAPYLARYIFVNDRRHCPLQPEFISKHNGGDQRRMETATLERRIPTTTTDDLQQDMSELKATST